MRIGCKKPNASLLPSTPAARDGARRSSHRAAGHAYRGDTGLHRGFGGEACGADCGPRDSTRRASAEWQ